MWASDNWKDYELIDCGRGEKLERWGDQLLVRPDPQAIWNTPACFQSRRSTGTLPGNRFKRPAGLFRCLTCLPIPEGPPWPAPRPEPASVM